MSGNDRHFLRVENFDVMQNPKRPTRPTWIKSFVRDLDDATWLGCSLAVRGFIGDFQKLAAIMGNRVPDDCKFIAYKLSSQPQVVGVLLSTCIRIGFVSRFVEDAKTSKENDLREKIATPSIPPSSSTSSSSSLSPCGNNSNEGTGLRAVPNSEPPCPQCDGEGCGWCREERAS